MNYIIWIVTPANYQHSQCFSEMAEALRDSFIELGHGCEVTNTYPTSKENVIILGAHLARVEDVGNLNEPIVWQLEQIDPDTLTTGNINVLRKAQVWDYSLVNIATLSKMGIDAKRLEVGYMPCLTRIENAANPDIDVLFIGSINERRRHVLRDLADSDVNVVYAFNCYGKERDALIARAKIVLNLHYYEAKIFEIARCSYLFANEKCVVSEIGHDLALEKPYYGAAVFSTYETLSRECLKLLEDDTLRKQWASAGFERFSKKTQTEFLREVLC